VEPPEVDTLLFKRMQHEFEITLCECLVRDVVGDVLLRRRIDTHGPRHLRIRRLPWLYAGGRMQIEAGLQVIRVQAVEKSAWVRKEFLVPCVARPSQEVP